MSSPITTEALRLTIYDLQKIRANPILSAHIDVLSKILEKQYEIEDRQEKYHIKAYNDSMGDKY